MTLKIQTSKHHYLTFIHLVESLKLERSIVLLPVQLYGLGSMLVVVGFLVMNCGSLLYGPEPQNINLTLNKIARNTILAGGGGCMVSALIAVLTMPKEHIKTLSYVVNGTFAGMVS